MVETLSHQAVHVADLRDAFFSQDAGSDEARYGLTRTDLADAMMVWSTCNGDVSLSEVAYAFRVSEELARDVVANHPWLMLEGDRVVQIGT